MTIISISNSLSFTPTPSASISQNNTQECEIDDEELRLPLAILYSLFFLVGLAGNLFALWVFLFLHMRRNSVRVFLINCAMADLVLVACLPFRVMFHAQGNQWILGPLACKLVGNVFYMNMYVSITLLGLISLDRYLRLSGRGSSRRQSVRGCLGAWSWVACAVLWGSSLLALVPMVMASEDREDVKKCFQFRQRQKAKGKAYFNGVLVLLFWVVFAVLVASYVKIAAQLLQVSRNKPDLPNSRRYARTAKKSFFVLFLFIVCFGPYHVFRPVYILAQLTSSLSCTYLGWVDRTNEVMLLLSAFNSCLDPVMYLLLSSSVRKAAQRALGKRFNFVGDTTSYSSNVEFRRPSLCLIVQNVPQATTVNSSSLPDSKD